MHTFQFTSLLLWLHVFLHNSYYLCFILFGIVISYFVAHSFLACFLHSSLLIFFHTLATVPCQFLCKLSRVVFCYFSGILLFPFTPRFFAFYLAQLFAIFLHASLPSPLLLFVHALLTTSWQNPSRMVCLVGCYISSIPSCLVSCCIFCTFPRLAPCTFLTYSRAYFHG